MIEQSNGRQFWRNRRFLRLFDEEILYYNPDGDNGGGIRRKRVSFQYDKVKTKEVHRSGLERSNQDVHSRMGESQKRSKRDKSGVKDKKLAGL